ncbi:response regulator, partial [Arthrospira platensis SPKY1]|nr:response regulator [Arthrospira platensis SPKY1]
LMDLEMPLMDGFEATARIRAWETSGGHHRTPILAISADAFSEDRVRSLAVGMDGFVAKPIVVDELLAALDKCLRARAIDAAPDSGSTAEVCRKLDVAAFLQG